MKIALGTVQFGIPYGINNIKGIPDGNEIKNIFRLAHDSGISILDTAPAYGDAEIKIGEFSNSKFKVVTKFSYANNEIELRSQLKKSLQDLGTSNVYGYLAHNADNLLKVPELWRVLSEARDEKLIKKIGYSLYSPEQLDMLLSNGLIPDLVQIPYSLLDRKFETALSILKNLGAEIHVRSVFLQGLYFKNPNELPFKLAPLKSQLVDLQKLCKMHSLSIGALALNFVVQNLNVDQVVIGVEKESQLKQNLEMIQTLENQNGLMEEVRKLVVSNKNLLNPANW